MKSNGITSCAKHLANFVAMNEPSVVWLLPNIQFHGWFKWFRSVSSKRSCVEDECLLGKYFFGSYDEDTKYYSNKRLVVFLFINVTE